MRPRRAFVSSTITDLSRIRWGGEPLGKPRVAVIDENRVVRDGLTSLLLSYAEVEGFASSDQFLADARDAAFDCVLAETLQAKRLQLQLIREGAVLPVVHLASSADVPAAVEAVKLGAVDFLVHPLSAEVLLQALEAALREKRCGVPDRYFPPRMDLDAMLDRMERELIGCALMRANGVVGGRNGAAAILGVTRTGLLYKMKRLGITRAVLPEGETAALTDPEAEAV